jgi:hypothetical protein
MCLNRKSNKRTTLKNNGEHISVRYVMWGGFLNEVESHQFLVFYDCCYNHVIDGVSL